MPFTVPNKYNGRNGITAKSAVTFVVGYNQILR